MTVILLFLTFASITAFSQALKVQDQKIVNDKGENVLLRGIGLGGWMLQEPYMLQISGRPGTQSEIRARIEELIGKENTEKFYKEYRKNMITKRDIDSLKAWGFNSVRLPMHYNLFTLPVDKEPNKEKNTWIKEGFLLTDSLLKWCSQDGIYLILDLHATPGGQGNDRPIADIDTTKPRLWESRENQQKTIELWSALAKHYSEEKWIGGYDLINETNYNLEGNTQLLKLFVDITDAIRKSDNKHIIFIEGNKFANDFTGLVPPWDKNMAYSFHKYWDPPVLLSVQKFINLREDNNVPLWMGESGENNNGWYVQFVKLLESNNIGWSWWTIKKLGSATGIMTVRTPKDYWEIINYWKGNGPKPSEKVALEVFMELAENMKIENCKINYDVLNALFGYSK